MRTDRRSGRHWMSVAVVSAYWGCLPTSGVSAYFGGGVDLPTRGGEGVLWMEIPLWTDKQV